MAKASSFDRGGVRELSYDVESARLMGQTEEEIHAEAAQEDAEIKAGLLKPRRVYGDRFYLLRFLGLRS